jgi:hypothetical protein
MNESQKEERYLDVAKTLVVKYFCMNWDLKKAISIAIK